MEIKDIRKNNINLLADKYGRTTVAERLGYPDNNYLNQLCGGHTAIGNRTARKVEDAFDLNKGWMDYPQRADAVRESGAIYNAAPLSEDVVELMGLIEEKARKGALTRDFVKLLKQQIEMMANK